MKVKISGPATRVIPRLMLKANKNAPTLLFIGGVAGVVGATVLACKATLKLEAVIEKSEDEAARVKELAERQKQSPQKELTKTKIRAAGEVGKLYAPAIVVGVVSVGVLTKSHTILLERNTALMAAYSAVDYAFRQYRERVVDELGEDKDLEFRHGSEVRTIVEETSRGSKVREVMAVGPNMPSLYARFFDDGATEWQRDPEYNFTYLSAQQAYWNNRLQARGHVFLNEIYDALGLKRSKAGQFVGWVWRKDGTNYIDFGVWDRTNSRKRDFVNGHEGSILLDFNVDGVIYDLVEGLEGEYGR